MKVNKEVSFGDYHVKYAKKEQKEQKDGVPPTEVNKESVKVMKGDTKLKLRKKEKLALIDAVKADNVDQMNSLLQSVNNQ
jgi:hypothetical protein